MSLTALKIIAFITMFIDHIGFATGNVYCRLIGRISFPIFAYLIAFGSAHTKNRKKYVRNLLMLGIISEIPYNLFISGSLFCPNDQNVMFTLLFGLLITYMIDRMKEKKISILYFLPLSLLLLFISHKLHFDYGFRGIILIVLLYLSKNNPFLISFSIFSFSLMPMFIGGITEWKIISLFAILSIPLLVYHKKSNKPKHYKLFKIGSYLFYPLHMLLLALIF